MKRTWGLGRTVVLAAAILAAAIVVAACGGGGSSSSSGTTESESAGGSEATKSEEASETGSGGEAKVEKILGEAYAPAKWEGPTEKDPAAKGKHVALIMTLAAAEGEQLLQQGAETATKALGWKSTYIDGKGTPQGYEAGINQAITEGVDGVVLGAITPSLVPNGMKALKAAGIPVVVQSNVEEPKEGLWLGNIGYNPQKEAEFLAAFMAKESGGEAKIALLEDKEFGIVSQRAERFKPLLEELCSSCEIANETDMQVTELETKLGPKMGGVLQANPEVNYVYAPYDAAVPPIVAAIKQAGLQDSVKVVSYGGFKQSTEYLRKKEIQNADVANATQWQAWEAYDVLNRTFGGQKIPSNAWNTDPIKLLTWENAPAAGTYFEGDEAEFEQHYKELWGVK
ncbi:MAG: sugar ABC transporter substrate-binding protein [Actinobacteria bacterium]|nr:sugar ABC transporter substrate-binding protein [Actinomycetota bacterium]